MIALLATLSTAARTYKRYTKLVCQRVGHDSKQAYFLTCWQISALLGTLHFLGVLVLDVGNYTQGKDKPCLPVMACSSVSLSVSFLRMGSFKITL